MLHILSEPSDDNSGQLSTKAGEVQDVMCRLFGMSGGSEPVSATFWLLQAPDSLSDQSRKEPDGTGIGYFDDAGKPVLDKQAQAAFKDQAFAHEAQTLRSPTFVAHVRYATTGELKTVNTHPFEIEGRMFAHNGVIQDLPALESELGPDMAWVKGDTDSERWFALITREIQRHDGDVAAGISSATKWVAEHLQVLSVNFILIDGDHLWALRYPDTHPLWVLERAAGGHRQGEGLQHAGEHRPDRLKVHADELAHRPAVIVATERMDDDPGWRSFNSGELLSVAPDLTVGSQQIIDGPPRHLLTVKDLHGRAAAAQQQ